MSLIDKIKKARESNVEIDGVTFTIRRPTDYEAFNELMETGADNKTMILKVDSRYIMEHFVTGWAGMNECMLIPGGSPEPVPFSAEVFMAWAEENMGVWPILSKAIVDSFLNHVNNKGVELKKLEAG